MINYWLWLYLIVVPIIVFSVKPAAERAVRAWRLLIAIVLCYLGMNLALDRHYDILAAQVNSNPHATGVDFERVSASGASSLFLLFLGWFWATTYVGWWELVWRKRYRPQMVSMRKGCDDDWVSNLIVTVSYYITLFWLVMGVFVIGTLLWVLYQKM